jgi:hypothetical protein
MASPDGPRFLTSPPAGALEEPPPAAGPFRVPQPPVEPRRSAPRVVRRPEPEPEASAFPVAEPEPDALARYLGPGRMPRVIIKYPRVVGLALIALGVFGWRELQHVAQRLHDSTEGIVFYSRGTALMPAIGFGLGGFLLAFGRPADSRGYSPAWWNRCYIAVLVMVVVAVIALDSTYL